MNFIISPSYEFFSPALVDGLSLESEWQQVSSGYFIPCKFFFTPDFNR